MTASEAPADSGTCLVLVDFDNAYPPNADTTDAEIVVDFDRWIRLLARTYPLIDEFQIRLYGGWYDSSDLSRRGSEVAGIIPRLTDFPIPFSEGRLLRGSIDLAVRPLNSATQSPLLGTFRRRGSVPRLRLKRAPYPDECARTDQHCPAAILKSFTKNSSRVCPAEKCTTSTVDAFVAHEQKMVDTLLATDLLVASLDMEGPSVIVVVSSDSDFTPPLLAAAQRSRAALIQLCPSPNESNEYANSVLSVAGINVIEETDE